MVRIIKGDIVKKVPFATYDNFFKNNGWKIEGEDNSSPETPIKNEVKQDAVQQPEVETNDEEDVSDEDWEEALDEMQDDEIEKPISEMNKTELLEKAKKLGVEIPNNASNKQIRDLIKASM